MVSSTEGREGKGRKEGKSSNEPVVSTSSSIPLSVSIRSGVICGHNSGKKEI